MALFRILVAVLVDRRVEGLGRRVEILGLDRHAVDYAIRTIQAVVGAAVNDLTPPESIVARVRLLSGEAGISLGMELVNLGAFQRLGDLVPDSM